MAKDFAKKLRLVRSGTSSGTTPGGQEDSYDLSLQEGVTRLEDENRRLRSELKGAQRQSTVFKMLASIIEQQPPFSTFSPYNSITDRKAKITESAMLVLSDCHSDQEVLPNRVRNLEEFNFDVACQRAERIVDTTISHLVDNMKNYRFEKLYIAGLGDYVSGEIHGATEHSHWQNALKNSMGTGELIAMMVTDLSRYFPKIVFCSVSGNHGRRSVKKDYRGAHDNWDYLVMSHAATRLKNLVDDGRLEIVCPDAWSMVVSIYGWNFVLNHGDDIRCFVPGSRVTMKDGTFKAIESVEKGDIVLCSDGMFRSVHETMSYDHDGEIVHISAECLPNNTWSATPNHEVLVVPGQMVSQDYSNPKPEWMPIGHVSVGDYLVVPTPKIEEGEITHEVKTRDFLTDLPETLHPNEKTIPDVLPASWDLGYVLGQYVADGSVFGKNDKVKGSNYDHILEIAYNEEESEFWSDFIKSWERLFSDTPKLINRSDLSVRCQRLHAYGQRAANFIAALGGRGSHTKILHPSVMTWPIESLKGFLIGYLRGDGHTHRYQFHEHFQMHKVSAATCSAQLGMQIFWMARRCGYNPSIKFRTRSGNLEAHLGFYANDARELGPLTQRFYSASDNETQGIRRSSFPMEGYFLTQVTKAYRSIYTGKKYDLEVEGLHDYTVNCAVVHNSWNSLPWYGIERKVRRWSAIGSIADEIPNYFLFGHFHNMAMQQHVGGEVIINGSWSATDEFALESLGAYSEPYQWLMGVHPTYGLTWRMPIKLRTKDWRDNIGKQSRYTITQLDGRSTPGA